MLTYRTLSLYINATAKLSGFADASHDWPSAINEGDKDFDYFQYFVEDFQEAEDEEYTNYTIIFHALTRDLVNGDTCSPLQKLDKWECLRIRTNYLLNALQTWSKNRIIVIGKPFLKPDEDGLGNQDTIWVQGSVKLKVYSALCSAPTDIPIVEGAEIPAFSGCTPPPAPPQINISVFNNDSGYQKAAEVQALIDAALESFEIPDLSGFATKQELQAVVNELPDFATFLTASDLEGYVKSIELPDFNDFLKPEDLEPYLKTEDLPAIPAPPDLTPYALKEDLPDFTDFATNEDLAGFATIGAVQKAPGAITFVKDGVYGTVPAPITSNITVSFTSAKLGVINLIVHQAGAAPSFPAEFHKLTTSGNYVINVPNFIFCYYLSNTEVLYTISQKQ